jgi:hypothetical protein
MNGVFFPGKIGGNKYIFSKRPFGIHPAIQILQAYAIINIGEKNAIINTRTNQPHGT